ncbi:unnamed protein product [Closterium sp. NIES-65]|nr:unnamed protein product [Closterium sp. NIES-65]
MVGNVAVGSDHPIRVQTMTTSDTKNVQATVEEVMRIADRGAEICRITVQGRKEAEACEQIKNKLVQAKELVTHMPSSFLPCAPALLCLPVRMPSSVSPCACPPLSPRAPALLCLPVRLPSSVSPCACPPLSPRAPALLCLPVRLPPRAHALLCLPVRLPSSVSPCACPHLSPRASALLCLPVRLPSSVSPCVCPPLSPRASALLCLPVRLPSSVSPCACPPLSPRAPALLCLPVRLPSSVSPCVCPPLSPRAPALLCLPVRLPSSVSPLSPRHLLHPLHHFPPLPFSPQPLRSYNIPLVADIHFAPTIALRVADCFDKIRINPGNYADTRAVFKTVEYTDESYQQELEHIDESRLYGGRMRDGERSEQNTDESHWHELAHIDAARRAEAKRASGSNGNIDESCRLKLTCIDEVRRAEAEESGGISCVRRIGRMRGGWERTTRACEVGGSDQSMGVVGADGRGVFQPGAQVQATVLCSIAITSHDTCTAPHLLISSFVHLHLHWVFSKLVLKCKQLGRAMRIGTNHGSLSDRIMSYYGDSPRGMVESALEFARICRKHDYHNFVFSMKASNPVVMVAAYRLLAAQLRSAGPDWNYPLHLGVTEAGEGEDGRMKSAIGIGALLQDGLGDTIRVSLTEAPEEEIEPCSALANYGMRAAKLGKGVVSFSKWARLVHLRTVMEDFEEKHRSYFEFSRRSGQLPLQKEKNDRQLLLPSFPSLLPPLLHFASHPHLPSSHLLSSSPSLLRSSSPPLLPSSPPLLPSSPPLLPSSPPLLPSSPPLLPSSPPLLSSPPPLLSSPPPPPPPPLLLSSPPPPPLLPFSPLLLPSSPLLLPSSSTPLLLSSHQGDAIDFRGMLHRDGSVLMSVDAAMLKRKPPISSSLSTHQNPEALYRALACKMAVGMPFKVHTSPPPLPPPALTSSRTHSSHRSPSSTASHSSHSSPLPPLSVFCHTPSVPHTPPAFLQVCSLLVHYRSLPFYLPSTSSFGHILSAHSVLPCTTLYPSGQLSPLLPTVSCLSTAPIPSAPLSTHPPFSMTTLKALHSLFLLSVSLHHSTPLSIPCPLLQDLATVDSILLRQAPAADDKEASKPLSGSDESRCKCVSYEGSPANVLAAAVPSSGAEATAGGGRGRVGAGGSPHSHPTLPLPRLPPPPTSHATLCIPSYQRLALRRLQEVGVGVLVPVEALAAAPLPNAVALLSLEQAKLGVHKHLPQGGWCCLHVCVHRSALAASPPASSVAAAPLHNAVALLSLEQANLGVHKHLPQGAARFAVSVRGDESEEDLKALVGLDAVMLLAHVPPQAEDSTVSRVHSSRRLFEFLQSNNITTPVIHHISFPEGTSKYVTSTSASLHLCLAPPLPRSTSASLHLCLAPPLPRQPRVEGRSGAAVSGEYVLSRLETHLLTLGPCLRVSPSPPPPLPLLHLPCSPPAGTIWCCSQVPRPVDGLGDGVLLEAPSHDMEFLRNTSFGMLQGCRMRNTKTEFVSCPSCGRTLFDLQEVTASIRERTSHLPGVAIAIMGCIVNGPGEMADADFGYVGGAPGKIDLYVGKEVVQRAIPMEEATDALVKLIKDHGRWVEPAQEEEAAQAVAA